MEKFFCKAGNAYVIPNVYNRYAKSETDCVHCYNNVKQSICEKCAQYINSPKTK